MMKTNQLLLMTGLSSALMLVAGCNTGSDKGTGEGASEDHPGYKLVWSDEFDDDGLPDPARWTYDTEGNDAGWGNREEQVYTEADPENARVEDGILSITAVREDFQGKAFTSARLNSRDAWQYCIIEVRARLPEARGTWPAIWMMPGDWSFDDGGWPDVGEIDIMEHVGHDPGVIHSSAHSRDYQWQAGTQKTGTIEVPDATEAFHTYMLEWTPGALRSYVDDSLFFEYENEGLGASKWPYDKPYYLILNVAVGGAWGGQQGIDADAFPQTMEVDFVRVYQKHPDH